MSTYIYTHTHVRITHETALSDFLLHERPLWPGPTAWTDGEARRCRMANRFYRKPNPLEIDASTDCSTGWGCKLGWSPRRPTHLRTKRGNPMQLNKHIASSRRPAKGRAQPNYRCLGDLGHKSARLAGPISGPSRAQERCPPEQTAARYGGANLAQNWRRACGSKQTRRVAKTMRPPPRGERGPTAPRKRKRQGEDAEDARPRGGGCGGRRGAEGRIGGLLVWRHMQRTRNLRLIGGARARSLSAAGCGDLAGVCFGTR